MDLDFLLEKIRVLENRIVEMENDRPRKHFSGPISKHGNFPRQVLLTLGAISILVFGTLAFAATIPNSFTSGDPISASQMNENFNYIIDRLWEVTGSNLHYSTGNVGIGTSNPTQKLEVIGTVDADAFTVNGTAVGTSTSTYWNESAGNLDYTVGSVSIGTATPGSVLKVYGNVDSTYSTYGLRLNSQEGAGPRLQIGTAADTTFFMVLGAFGGINNLNSKGNDFHLYSTNSPTGLFFEESNGRVGIGTITPAYQLELSTDSAGKPTSNTWTIVSDARLKEDIKPFKDGLETILQINPVSCRLNGKAGMPKGTKGISVVAQEVVDVIPCAIYSFKSKLEPGDTEETELYSFDSSSLTFVLINAVKELKAENDDLKRRIAQLETGKE